MSEIPGAVARHGSELTKWLEETATAAKKVSDHIASVGDKAQEKIAQQTVPIVVDLQSRMQQAGSVGGAAIVSLAASMDTLNHAAQHSGEELVKAFDTWTQSATITLPQIDAYWGKIKGSINELAKTNMPAAISAYEDYIKALERVKAPQGEILKAEEDMLKMEISVAKSRGESTAALELQLFMLQRKMEDLKTASISFGDTLQIAVVGIFKDLVKQTDAAFESMTKSFGDAIFSGKGLGDVFDKMKSTALSALESIGKKIVDDLIGLAMKPLKGMIDGVVDSLGNLLGKGLSSLAGATTNTGGLFATLGEQGAELGRNWASLAPNVGMAAGQIQGLGSNAATAASHAGTLGTSMTGAVSSVASWMGAIGGVVGAIGSIGQFIQGFSMSKDMGRVEENTRVSALELQNIRKDDWDQYGQMYDRLGELLNAVREGLGNIFNRMAEVGIQTSSGGENFTRLGEI
ncbi:MAG TPA: hypothetical protein VNT76_16625, partial [Candidatus Binatus sp.]|nr:hypothetical protein [Candidatus Binatus sp.]